MKPVIFLKTTRSNQKSSYILYMYVYFKLYIVTTYCVYAMCPLHVINSCNAHMYVCLCIIFTCMNSWIAV